jgi:PAS domain S-box-containing protein
MQSLRLKTSRFKNYIIISTATALLILLGTFIFIFSRYENMHLTDDIDRKLKSSEALFNSYLESDALMMGNALELILRDEKLKAAMKARDRRTLLALSQPIFEQLHAKAYFTHFYFTGPDRVNILRVHQPERYGDKIDRFTTLQAEKTGKFSHGIELGPLGTFTLRVVVPWFDDKQLIGYVELGEEIEHIIEKLHKVLNIELYVLIEKQYLKRSDWEIGMKMLGNNAEWDRFPSVVLIAQTHKIFPDELSQLFSNIQYTPMMKRMQIILNKSHYSVNFVHLKDAANNDTGTMVILRDITGILAENRKDIFFALAICFVVGAFLVLTLSVFFGRVELQREQALSLLNATIESTAEGILVVDNQGIITTYNQKYLEMWRIPESMLDSRNHNKPLAFVMEQLKDPKAFMQKIRELYAQPDAEISDTLEFKDGRVFERYSQPQWIHGKIVGRFWSFRDITERKSAEEALQERENRYQMLFNNVSDAVFVHEVSKDTCTPGKFIEVNNIACQYLGYNREELLQMNVPQIDAPETLENVPNILKQLFAEGHTMWEGMHVSKDGRRIPVEISNQLFNLHGKPMILSTVRDITKRRQKEEELKLKAKLLDLASDTIYLHDFNGNFLYVNETACRAHGYTREEFLNRDLKDLDIPQYAELVNSRIREIQEKGASIFETAHFRKDGSILPLEVHVVTTESGGKKLMLSIGRDITERKTVEKKIKNTLSLLQAALESTSEGILVVDNYGKISLYNKKFRNMWRIPDNLLADSNDKSLLDYVLEQLKEPDAFVKKVDELYASPDKESYDILEFKDGRIFRRYSQAQRIDGAIVGRVWSFRDVTDRERAEKRIIEYQKKTEALINSSSDYIVLKDMDFRNIIINKACKDLFHLDINDIIGKTDFEFMPEEIALNCRKSDEEALRSERVVVTEEFSMGKWFHAVKQRVIDEDGKSLGVAAVIRDITDRKEHEIKLAKSLKEKEMLLKELHHRVKNNLQILTSLISFQIKDDNEARVNQILTECKDRVRTIAIIHEKLYQASDFSSIEVRKLISDIASSLVYSLRDTGNQTDLILNIQDISIGIDVAIPLGLIINEIVSNSVKHAFPSEMKGEVNIDFHTMNGEFVLNVHDNGIGLPEDFNTEKSDSLGMYLIYTLVEQLNGRVEFMRNNGTAVKIHFKK